MTEQRAKKMLSPAIEVDASTMAGTWNVAFRTNRTGFTVWLTVGSGLPDSVKTHTVHKPLSWRVAAEVLANMYEDGLEGDWGDQIVVRGVDGWRAEILKMAAVTSENPSYDSLQILMSLGEDEIASTYDRFGSLLSDESEEYILVNWGERLEIHDGCSNHEESFADLELITSNPAPSSLNECCKLLIQWLHVDKKPKRNLSSNVSWDDQRAWIMWLFNSPDDLLCSFSKQHPEAAKSVVANIRKMVARSAKDVEHAKKYGNQASQIGIGLMQSFMALANKKLDVFDRKRDSNA